MLEPSTTVTPAPAQANLLPALALMVNALVWGLSWWPFRWLQQHGLHPMWATALIYALCTVCALLWRPQTWRALPQHPWLWLLLLSAGLSNAGFNWAVTVGDVVRAVLLFYLMPAWSLLLAWPVLGERPGAAALGRLALALCGLVIVLGTPGSPWPLPHDLADAMALMGGFCFALTNVLLRRLNHTPAPARVLAMFAGGALLPALAALIGLGGGVVPLPPAPAPAWVGMLLAVGAAFLLSNITLQYGAARLRASTTALVMLSEVVFASVSSILLGAGILGGRTVLGGALIMLAALLAVWPARAR